MTQRRVEIYKKDFLSSCAILVLGLFYGLMAYRLPIWGETGPQEGFFPLAVTAIIVVFGLWILSKSFVVAPTKEEEKSPEDQGTVNFSRVISYGTLLLIFAIFFEKVGFLITSGIFLTLILRYTEKQNWKITILISALALIGSYLLFVYLLGVPLPKGLLK